MKKSMLSRLCLCLPLILCACSKSDLTAPASTAQPINIVFIMSDDHAVQALGAYNHPISKLAPTPNIDRIANEGMVFANSFVTNSLCGPSRAALLTGKFGHINGFTRNGDIFDTNQSTWPKLLKDAGYQTALIGKWHIGKTPEGLNLDYWQILDDQGEYYNPEFITRSGIERVEGYATDLITQFSLKWLKEQRNPKKPFLLMVQHKAPHRNWMPALRHLDQYEAVKFPLPDTYFDNYEGREAAQLQKMNIYKDMHEGHDLKMTDQKASTSLRYDPWPGSFARMTKQQRRIWDSAYQHRNDLMNSANLNKREMALWKYQRYMQDYLATISSVDEGVGDILDYLDQQGLSENTLVVYTSDQGFFLGEHGWFDKRFIYEQSLRTPLLMKLPGRIKAGSSSQAMVQNIDYAPTFLDFAGVKIPTDIQGQSLTNIAGGQTPADWRQSIYYHYYEYPGAHSVRAHDGIRTNEYKLAHFYGDINSWEFYDLAADPKEMHNLISNPDYQKQIIETRSELQTLRMRYQIPDKPKPGDLDVHQMP